jgi:hypothetical protein
MIIPRGDEFCVISHQTGKNFGCYKTEKEAEERLKEIRGFSSKEKDKIGWFVKKN